MVIYLLGVIIAYLVKFRVTLDTPIPRWLACFGWPFWLFILLLRFILSIR